MKVIAPLAAAFVLLAAFPSLAQWRNVPPDTKAPRTKSGDVDLEAPPPRHANGRVSLEGVWMPNDNRYIRDLALDVGEAKVPYQPWARKLTDERKDGTHSREDPDAHCLPQGVPKIDYVSYPWKLVETPTSVVMMFETFTFWRQIFTDGRTPDPAAKPSWMGYSVGHWEGDTLVVETTQTKPNRHYYGVQMLDSVMSDQFRVVEQFTRTAPDQIRYRATVHDPVFTTPWTVEIFMHPQKGELVEYACHEGNYGMRGLLSAAREEEKATEGIGRAHV